MNRLNLYSALSCDVVGSTTINPEDFPELYHNLENVLLDLKKRIPGMWFRIIRGDSIECLFTNPNEALRVAIIIKCYLKYWLNSIDCSQKSREYALRFSIGIGTMRITDMESQIIDGPAIYISGRNLDRISMRGIYSSFDMEGANKDISNFINASILALDDLINKMSAKQAIVIYYKLIGFLEKEIAKELHISQASVNVRSSLAQWGLVLEMITSWEHIDFYNYV